MWADGELRGFVARLLGWAREREVEQSLASIELAAAGCAHLVLCGAGDLVPIAYALHRRTLGSDKPFIVCDPRRGNTVASVRSPGNHKSGAAAILAAAGWTLCVRFSRLPRDFAFLVETIRVARAVQYVICAGEECDLHPLLVVPVPIRLPLLRDRADELPRIVDEYARRARGAGRSRSLFHGRRSGVGARARGDVVVRDREGDAAACGTQGLGEREQCCGPARDGAGVAVEVDRAAEDAAGVAAAGATIVGTWAPAGATLLARAACP
jgi:hypothetical protein